MTTVADTSSAQTSPRKRVREDSTCSAIADAQESDYSVAEGAPIAADVPESLSDGPFPGLLLSRTGVKMPSVGLGTFRCKGKTCQAAVAHAVGKVGVRLVDTAEGYKNECDVATGIKQSGIPRRDIFLVTKVSKDSMKSSDTVRSAVESSLKNLGTDYIDLLLIHWPGTSNSNTSSPLHSKARIAAWKVLQEFHAQKVARHIGVSNFTTEHLKELEAAEGVDVVPHVNQIECHPYWPQDELRSYCTSKGIAVQAYTSLGRCTEPPKVLYGIREPDHPRLVKDEGVLGFARELNITPAQVLLRWGLQRGMGIIPKAGKIEHIEENYKGLVSGGDAAACPLTKEQLEALDGLLSTAGFEAEVRYAYPKHKVPK